MEWSERIELKFILIVLYSTCWQLSNSWTPKYLGGSMTQIEGHPQLSNT